MKRITFLLSLVLASVLNAEVITFTKYVPVRKSVQIERVVVERAPVEECWYEDVPVDERTGDETVGAIIGGAAGGILGHQVGRGSGKTAATVGGAIIGTLIGKSLAERSRVEPGYKRVRRCRTRYKERERRVYEYRNIAYVEGRKIVKYSDRPLREIPVKVTIEY